MKKIIKTISLILLMAIALVLLTVGPLYKIGIAEGVILGEKVLSIVRLESLSNNYYLQTISSAVSGLIFGFVISFIVKGSKRKAKKEKTKKSGEVKGPDSSLKVNFPNPDQQNTHKKNNIKF